MWEGQLVDVDSAALQALGSMSVTASSNGIVEYLV